MTASLRSVVASFALLGALGLATAAVAAERVLTPVPWKAGETVIYETESLHRERVDGAPVARRATDRTEIRVDAAGRDGYALSWATYDSRVEAIEGDRTTTDLIAPLLDTFDGYAIHLELDRDGRYRRVRNLDALAAKLRTAMLPIFSANLDRMFATTDAKHSKYDQDVALTIARQELEQHMDELISLDSVETMASAQIRSFSAFAGKSLTPGRRYRDAEPLRSPQEGAPLPATREYVLTLDRDDPNLARIRWTHTLDANGDPKALWALVEELGDTAEDDAPRKGKPQDLSLREEGLMVFRRDTGAIEMVETIVTTRYGKLRDEQERSRMRLQGSARTWAQEDAARDR